ncbi:MAG: hypothetical protein ACOXZY_00160 [Patescibacteria group bacterium]
MKMENVNNNKINKIFMFKNFKKFIIISLFAIIFSGVLFSVVSTATVGDALNVLDRNVVPATNITGSSIPQGDLAEAAGFWIKIALSVVGVLFFVLIFYAAFTWMVSEGEEEKVKKSRNTIVASVIGLMIIVSSYAVTNIIINNFVNRENSIGPINEGEKGCCVDWVKSDPIQIIAIPACRITTNEDCRLQGSTLTKTDVHYGSEGKGIWTWDRDIKDIKDCSAKCGG